MIDHKQELFDKVSKHLLKQNKKAHQNGSCRYRTTEGLSCAVGCLIADKHYHPNCEGVSIPSSLKDINTNVTHVWDISAYTLVASLIESLGYTPTTDDLSLLRSLQFIHDDYDVDNWRDELMKLAFDERLAFNEGSA